MRRRDFNFQTFPGHHCLGLSKNMDPSISCFQNPGYAPEKALRALENNGNTN